MQTLNNAFRSLVNGNTGTTANGIAGTNNDIRSIVWDTFRTKYNDTVTVMIDGVLLTFKANHSISGKSTSYISGLTDEQYIKLNGSDFGLSKRKDAYMTIQNGVIQIYGGGNYYAKISNDKVYFQP